MLDKLEILNKNTIINSITQGDRVTFGVSLPITSNQSPSKVDMFKLLERKEESERMGQNNGNNQKERVLETHMENFIKKSESIPVEKSLSSKSKKNELIKKKNFHQKYFKC